MFFADCLQVSRLAWRQGGSGDAEKLIRSSLKLIFSAPRSMSHALGPIFHAAGLIFHGLGRFSVSQERFLIFLDGFFSNFPSEVEPLPRLSKEPLTDCAIRTCFFIAEMSDSLCAPVQRAASPRNQSGGTRLKKSKASLGQNSGHSIQRG